MNQSIVTYTQNDKNKKRGDTNERVESSKLRNEASMAEDQEVI